MRNEHQRIASAIDAGSNTIHLLAGRVVDAPGGRGRLAIEPLIDVSEFSALGTKVDATGEFGAEAALAVIDTLTRQIAAATAVGATSVVLLGTEPFRRARDASDVAERILAATGYPLHVLSHLEEGLLSILALTGGRPVRRPTLVVDIGGGSTECTFADAGGIRSVSVVRVGSARLIADAPLRDPPRRREVEMLREEARAHALELPDQEPASIVFMGGSATNLLKLDARALRTRMLGRTALRHVMAAILEMPAAEITATFGVNPRRAPLLAGGAVIVEAVMDRYGAAVAEVSPLSLREGAVFAHATDGEPWRRKLLTVVVTG